MKHRWLLLLLQLSFWSSVWTQLPIEKQKHLITINQKSSHHETKYHNHPHQAGVERWQTYGEEFFNPALQQQQSIRVIVPPSASNSTQRFPTVYVLHEYYPNATRRVARSVDFLSYSPFKDMAVALNQTMALFQHLMYCLSATREQLGCYWITPDSLCCTYCISSVLGTTEAIEFMSRMGPDSASKLPYIQPMIIVLADYRRGFYTNRNAGVDIYFPKRDYGDRAGRLLEGSTGNYEDSVLEVVKFVESKYPANFDRALFGQQMGGYGAVKTVLKHPSVFLGAAAQSAMLDLNMLVSMYRELKDELNTHYPEIYDVFGYGTFSAGNQSYYGIPVESTLALNADFIESNNPMSLLTKKVSQQTAIYLELNPADKKDLLVFNSTMHFCQKMLAFGIHGSSYANPDQYRTLSIGRALGFLSEVLSGETSNPPDCNYPI